MTIIPLQSKNNLQLPPKPKTYGLVTCIPAVGQYQDLCFSPLYLMEVIHSSGTSFGWKRKSGYN